MRIERVGLEHHAHRPVHRRQLVDPLTVDQQVAGTDVFQARDQPQQGRLAATGRTDEDHELAVLDVQVDIAGNRGAVVALADIAQGETSHMISLEQGLAE